MNEKDLFRIEVFALECYMLERTIPLITEQTEDGNPKLLGTCTLVKVGTSYFFVTAAHVLENVDLKQVAIPTYPRSGELWTIGSVFNHAIYSHPIYDPEYLDVAIIQVNSEEVTKILDNGWKPLQLEMLGNASESGRFALCGYPESYSRKIGSVLTGKLLTVYTGRLTDAPQNADQPVDSDIDLFFLCDNSAQNLFGQAQTIPALQGTSGSSIWEIREPSEGEAWAPERVLRVVGINSSYRKQEYFRAKRWRIAAAMFGKMEEGDVSSMGELLCKRLA